MALPFLQTGLEAVDLVQGFVDDVKADRGAVQDAQGYSIASGRLIEDIDLANGSFTNVEHKLGRAAKGYVVARRSANAVVWDQESSDDSSFLALQSSASVTVSLWVF